jgi:hypothetical protein
MPMPRSFTLWLEPIITVAALARLHRDFGWPADLVGAQSTDWAFDLVGFRSGSKNEYLAGEVKKSATEIAQLIEFMIHFSQDPSLGAPSSQKARNAYRKLEELRARHAPVFWAVGPGGISKAFQVEYGSKAEVSLVAADQDSLCFEPKTVAI